MDVTAQELHLQRTIYNDGVTGPRGVWWCAAENPYWVTSPGYGNMWDQRLTKGVPLPSSGPLTLTYTVQYDTEPTYDFVRVEISDDGGTNFTELAAYDGSTGGTFVTENTE